VKNLGLLDAINEHPMAMTMVLILGLIVHQIIKSWRGKTDATVTEHESLKLAKQTSQTVNKCASENHDFRKMVEKHLHENDVRQISAQLQHAVQLLEKMDADKSLLKMSLDGVARVSSSIADDIRRGDHRVVHTGMINQIDDVKRISEDIKRLAVHIAEKV